jgi:hypothetical protein
MKNEINLLKNNDNRDDSDEEWIEEFYNFLQGDCPDSISLPRGHQPKLTPKKAMTIIWYLQEHFPLLPDNIEKCWNCDGLFDTHSGGLYWESKGRHYCNSCQHHVPENYDNHQRQ